MSRTMPMDCANCKGVLDWGDFGPSGNDPDYAIEDKPTCTCHEWEWTGEYWEEASAPKEQPAASSPYRFTVSVEHNEWRDCWLSIASLDGNVIESWAHTTEAEARSHAALVLAALHQAAME